MLEGIRSSPWTVIVIVSGHGEPGASSDSGDLVLETSSEGRPTLGGKRELTHPSGAPPELPTRTSSGAIGSEIVESWIGSGISPVMSLDSDEIEWPFSIGQGGSLVPEVRRSVFRDRAPDADAKLAERQRSLLQRAGGGLRVEEVARLLKLSEREVEQRRAAQSLLAVRDSDSGTWIYPACQFKGGRAVPGLAQVLAGFTMQNPWTQLYVLISEDPALDGRTPVQALAEGETDAVLSIARGYGEQGAT